MKSHIVFFWWKVVKIYLIVIKLASPWQLCWFHQLQGFSPMPLIWWLFTRPSYCPRIAIDGWPVLKCRKWQTWHIDTTYWKKTLNFVPFLLKLPPLQTGCQGILPAGSAGSRTPLSVSCRLRVTSILPPPWLLRSCLGFSLLVLSRIRFSLILSWPTRACATTLATSSFTFLTSSFPFSDFLRSYL